VKPEDQQVDKAVCYRYGQSCRRLARSVPILAVVYSDYSPGQARQVISYTSFRHFVIQVTRETDWHAGMTQACKVGV
jgi:hypothetical protein